MDPIKSSSLSLKQRRLRGISPGESEDSKRQVCHVGGRKQEGEERVLGVILRDSTSQGHAGLLHLNGSQLRAEKDQNAVKHI